MSKRLLLCAVTVLSLAPMGWAEAYTWLTDGGNWNTDTNWSPTGIPGTGDTATVGDGSTAITMQARPVDGSTPPLPHPDSVTVRSGATLAVYDDVTYDPGGPSDTNQYFIIETGGVLDASDYNNKGWNAYLNTGTTLYLSNLTGNSDETITINGSVFFDDRVAPSTARTINQRVVGTGTLTANTDGTPLSVATGIEINGTFHVLDDAKISNGAELGDGTNPFTLHMDAGTATTVSWRYNNSSSFNGTQSLVLDGTGASAATLTFNDARQTLTLQLDTATFGGTPVPPGTYTVGTDYTGYLANTTAQTITIEVLNEIPEPATMTLLALGGVALLRRRR